MVQDAWHVKTIGEWKVSTLITMNHVQMSGEIIADVTLIIFYELAAHHI